MDDAALKRLAETVQNLKDRQDILDCLVREARGRDRHDAPMTSSCYWPDGADEHGHNISPGPVYGEKANIGHAAKFSANQHNLSNHTCEIEGDVANCETYVVGGLLSPDQKTCKIAIGRYFDRLEKRNGEWRIKLRRTTVEMVVDGDSTWLQSPQVAGLLKGVRTKDDPSYHRPIKTNPNDARW
jgi:hypothetical protein